MQEDNKLQREAQAQEKQELKAAEATEKKEEQILQKEADEKLQDAKAVRKGQVSSIDCVHAGGSNERARGDGSTGQSS